jgi:rRNA-processing protein FCF1
MLRVVIDTNNLPLSAESKSAAMVRLDKLLDEGVLTVLMPAVIAEEWRTQRLEGLKGQLQKASTALSGLASEKALLTDAVGAAFASALEKLDELTPKAEELSHALLERLVTRLKAEVIETGGHGERVLASYFRGDPPFSSPKSRKDFPDAFLFETVRAAVGQAGEDTVAVATKDANLAKHLSKLGGVLIFDSLEALVESDEVRGLVSALEQETLWRQRIPQVIERLQELSDADLVARVSDSFVDKLALRNVSHPSIPADNQDATVSMVDDPTDIEIDWDDVSDYGPGLLRIPFSCSSELLLDFYVYYADAYGMNSDHISITWADPETHRFFDAQSYTTAHVEGYLLYRVTGWQDGVQLDNVEITVDAISEAELEEDDAGNALH